MVVCGVTGDDYMQGRVQGWRFTKEYHEAAIIAGVNPPDLVSKRATINIPSIMEYTKLEHTTADYLEAAKHHLLNRLEGMIKLHIQTECKSKDIVEPLFEFTFIEDTEKNCLS